MAEYFCFKGKDECGTTRYIDIPENQCVKGMKVIAYHNFHGGSNQQWRWDQGRIVSSISPKFGLAAQELEDGAIISLHYLDKKSESKDMNDKWVLKDGVITPEGNDKFHLGLVCDKLLLRTVSPSRDPTIWEVDAIEPAIKPASSCHLQYEPIPQDKLSDSWTLENTVCVRSSADCTYFCVIGWGPGGYSGVQQINENHKVAIFSMWNDGLNSVKELERGNGVTVRSFGGEGTGLKAMKNVQWKRDQKITFRVTGIKHDTGDEIVWRCSCWYFIEGDDWTFMASYERPGNTPFNQHFYSFVEDWDRSNNSEGHVHRRCAEFSDPKVITAKGETYWLKEAIFTKQSEGADKFGREKAFCGVNGGSRCFILSTGGDTRKYICDSIEKGGCQQTSSTTLTKLRL